MLLSRWASIDDRSPFGDFWFEPVSRHSLTGQRVGAEQAMRLAAVYACVALLSKCFALMPFKLWRPQSGGGRQAVVGHWATRLFSARPNRFQNPFEFRQMLMGHLALRGNAFCTITAPRGTITELLPKHPDRMKVELLPGNEYRYAYLEPDGTTTRYPRGEIWHLRGLSNNGLMGLSPIEMQRDVIGLGLGAQEYGARFFANDATPPGWIEMPGTFADKTKKDNFRESWQNNQVGRNRGKTAVLEGGMKYHEIEVKNSDAQYLESRRFTVSEIARIFGVPPHLIGDLDRATFANIEQQSLEFVIYTLQPIAAAWAASIAYALLNEDEEDDLQPDFDVEQLLKGDRASRADFYTKMFGVGAYSTNDIRGKEGDNPVDGGEMRFRPVNLSPLRPEDAEKFPAPAAHANPPRPPGDQNREDPSEARAAALAGAAAARIARKELEAVDRCGTQDQIVAVYEKHARFVAEALNVSEELARAYCREQLRALATGIGPAFEENTRARLMALALRTP